MGARSTIVNGLSLIAKYTGLAWVSKKIGLTQLINSITGAQTQGGGVADGRGDFTSDLSPGTVAIDPDMSPRTANITPEAENSTSSEEQNSLGNSSSSADEKSIKDFENKSLTTEDLDALYSIIIKNMPNTSNMEKLAIWEKGGLDSLRKLNLTPSNLEYLQAKATEDISKLHENIAKMVYFKNNFLPKIERTKKEIKDDISGLYKAQLESKGLDAKQAAKKNTLNYIHDHIEQAVHSQWQINSLNDALTTKHEAQNDPYFTIDKGTGQLQSVDFKYLTQIALDKITKDSTKEQCTLLRDKIANWVENIQVTGGSYSVHVNETGPIQLEADITQHIQQLTASGDFDPVLMATISFCLNAYIKEHAIEGAPKIGIFAQDIVSALSSNGRYKSFQSAPDAGENMVSLPGMMSEPGNMSVLDGGIAGNTATAHLMSPPGDPTKRLRILAKPLLNEGLDPKNTNIVTTRQGFKGKQT